MSFKNWTKGTPNKYNATKIICDGITFDSKAEFEMYKLIKADSQTLHVDIHVPLSLPGGIRLNVDFLVYKKRDEDGGGIIEVIEVKGKPDNAFPRMRKLFDECHPLGPMKVFKLSHGKWENL